MRYDTYIMIAQFLAFSAAGKPPAVEAVFHQEPTSWRATLGATGTCHQPMKGSQQTNSHDRRVHNLQRIKDGGPGEAREMKTITFIDIDQLSRQGDRVHQTLLFISLSKILSQK
jgi:hypothetical protein